MYYYYFPKYGAAGYMKLLTNEIMCFIIHTDNCVFHSKSQVGSSLVELSLVRLTRYQSK